MSESFAQTHSISKFYCGKGIDATHDYKKIVLFIYNQDALSEGTSLSAQKWFCLL